MEQFNVGGMTCAACSARVEKAVNSVDGVTSCSVSLLTNSMGVEGTANIGDIIQAVTKAGYTASLKGEESKSADDTEDNDSLKDTETPKLKKRLIASIGFVLVLMYFSMGHMMWNWPVPSFLENNHVAMGIIQLLLSGIVMVINQKFFINGFKALINRSPNMDTLVALGSGVSFVWSVYTLFAMTVAQMNGDSAAVMTYMHEFYFESAAMILALITVGKMLEARSKGKTTDALKSLMKLSAKTATVLKDGKETEIPIKQVRVNDIFIVRPGQSIPVDGIVVEGSSTADESMLSGESLPTEKAVGSEVSAGTLNGSGFLKCRATRVGSDTTLSQIIKMVSDAAATKAPIAKIADKVSGIFVPTVIIIAIVTTVIWLLVGKDAGFSLARGISVLVISCPCALGLATPVAIMVGNGVGAKNGLLFKTAVSLEETGKADIVCLDKTGTVTKGEMNVTDIYTFGETDEENLLSLAYSLEIKSEHPLAKAVVRKGKSENANELVCESFNSVTGGGIEAVIDGKQAYAGNARFIKSKLEIPKEAEEKADSFAKEGKTPLYFSQDGKLCGIIAVADTIKEEAKEAVKQLKNMGIKVAMLTGDNRQTANAIAKQAGIDEVLSEVLPGDKESAVRSLQKEGKVIMVGDGINDAPALTRADVGMAIGAGTSVAIEAADVVLVKSRLTDVPAAVRLSRAVLRNIHENLFWAFFYNCIGIPLAAGAFIALLGWQLNPMFGAAAMSLSSFCVVTNALRLNFVKVHSTKHDRKVVRNKIHKKEQKTMQKVFKVKGMMCPHCEASVKKALEEIDGVESAVASHTDGTATVELSKDVSDEILKSAIVDKGYEVVE